jgi:tetratricopeptide (TPR) repeat protein
LTGEDRIASGTWGMDPSAVVALRLSKTREAFQNRDLLTALLEAEDLLEEDPGNVEALEVLGDTELELGHGREAALVFAKLHGIDARRADYLSGLAVARFLDTDFDGSLGAAKMAIELQDENAEAAAYAGLSLERLGRKAEAAPFLRRATELDSEGFPTPVPISKIPWKRVLREAIARLPQPIQDFYRRIPIVWHHLPDVAVLRSVDPPISPMALVLYEGTPPEPDEATGERPEVLPRSIRIFQGNACRFAHEIDQLVLDLSLALHSEAADWLGLPFESEEGEE